MKHILHQGMSSVVFPEENKLIERALILNADFLSERWHDTPAPIKSVSLISSCCSLTLHCNTLLQKMETIKLLFIFILPKTSITTV